MKVKCDKEIRCVCVTHASIVRVAARVHMRKQIANSFGRRGCMFAVCARWWMRLRGALTLHSSACAHPKLSVIWIRRLCFVVCFFWMYIHVRISKRRRRWLRTKLAASSAERQQTIRMNFWWIASMFADDARQWCRWCRQKAHCTYARRDQRHPIGNTRPAKRTVSVAF